MGCLQAGRCFHVWDGLFCPWIDNLPLHPLTVLGQVGTLTQGTEPYVCTRACFRLKVLVGHLRTFVLPLQ